MPSHIHLIARCLKGNLNEILRDFKSFTSKEILKAIENEPGESRRDWLLHMFKYYAEFQKQNTTYMFWQKTSHTIELNYPSILQEKINYIHNNPMAAGMSLILLYGCIVVPVFYRQLRLWNRRPEALGIVVTRQSRSD